MKAIVSVIGYDKVGIIAGVTTVLAENNVNILDINQTILQEYFTMIMLVDLSGMTITFGEMKDMLERKGEAMGLKIRVQHEDIFNSMHRI